MDYNQGQKQDLLRRNAFMGGYFLIFAAILATVTLVSTDRYDLGTVLGFMMPVYIVAIVVVFFNIRSAYQSLTKHLVALGS